MHVCVKILISYEIILIYKRFCQTKNPSNIKKYVCICLYALFWLFFQPHLERETGYVHVSDRCKVKHER